MTLVWNGENEIGSGHTTDHGLSAFGKAVIPELERCGILVDVSHLNDPGFYDLLEVAQSPFWPPIPTPGRCAATNATSQTR